MIRIILFLCFFALASSLTCFAQVGINTITPDQDVLLDVNGNVKLNDKLFLEAPGDYTNIRGSKLLIQKTNSEIIQYNIDQSKYGPINYAQFIFSNTSPNGIQDYNTQISTTDYLVTVQGFYFLENGTNNTNVLASSAAGNNYVEGFQVYAYAGTNTWYIRAFINNATFSKSGGTDINVDLYLNLIIFRNGLISKSQSDVSVDMGGNTTITVPTPAGF
ncbi:hypothetical protein ACH3O9_15070 [Leeuwenhoekiella sp. A16]|uniref:hypothetical protein n=1 Tax=unclassified Leeuwenhoekiella TaxID=2615029 RepID=UPI003A7FEF34